MTQEKMTKQDKTFLSIFAPVSFEQLDDQEETNKFMITAFTGEVVDRWYGRLAIEMKGISISNKIPVLKNHNPDNVVGWSTKTSVQDKLYVHGKFSESTPYGKEVQALGREGFPWQASIGVWAKKIKHLESEKESEIVNGKEIFGPCEIWTKSEVREVSFVPLGADKNTSADIFSMQTKENNSQMEITLDILTANAPELLESIKQDSFKQGEISGIDAERKRVVEILKVEDVDQEARTKAICDGLSVDASFKLFFEAEKNKKKEALEELQDETPESVGQTGKTKTDKEDFMAEVDRYQKENKCSRTDALRAVVESMPKLYEAYLKRGDKQ